MRPLRFPRIGPQLLLRAYASGVFPMAAARGDPTVHWVDPVRRGVLPLERFHMPRSLARTVRRGIFEIATDGDFPAVVRACAAREETWINPLIERLYGELFRAGFAHSVECRRNGALAGGLYGVALGGAFFGESMFSRVRDASKVALAHLAARLSAGGFRLLDIQFLTDHLARFGAVEVSRAEYRRRLERALTAPADFYSLPASAPASAWLPLVSGAPPSGAPSPAASSSGGAGQSSTTTS